MTLCSVCVCTLGRTHGVSACGACKDGSVAHDHNFRNRRASSRPHMSADDFARLQSELNPAGTAFTERLQAAEREFAALQAVEKELKTDEAKFSAHLQALRQSLETNSRSLSAVHAKRARLAKELAACDEEISRLDAEKVEVSARMHKATSRAAGNREKKLRALDSSHGGAGSKGGGTSPGGAGRRWRGSKGASDGGDLLPLL